MTTRSGMTAGGKLAAIFLTNSSFKKDKKMETTVEFEDKPLKTQLYLKNITLSGAAH